MKETLQRRGYEIRAVANIHQALLERRRVLAVGPTGCNVTCVGLLKTTRLPAVAVFGVLLTQIEIATLANVPLRVVRWRVYGSTPLLAKYASRRKRRTK